MYLSIIILYNGSNKEFVHSLNYTAFVLPLTR